MAGRPFNELFDVTGHRHGRRSIDVLKNRVENRPRLLAQFGHQIAKFTVEITQEERGALTEDREPRVVDRTDRVRPS